MSIEYLIKEGIDVNSSIELLGDEEMYNDTLKEFFNESKSNISKLEEFMNNKDMENYSILVHSIKSDSKYLGFEKLANIALNHEMESKNSNINYILDNFSELKEEFDRIVLVVSKYLGE